jgi:hypothetical protein
LLADYPEFSGKSKPRSLLYIAHGIYMNLAKANPRAGGLKRPALRTPESVGFGIGLGRRRIIPCPGAKTGRTGGAGQARPPTGIGMESMFLQYVAAIAVGKSQKISAAVGSRQKSVPGMIFLAIRRPGYKIKHRHSPNDILIRGPAF